jgi:hypothetical protein
VPSIMERLRSILSTTPNEQKVEEDAAYDQVRADIDQNKKEAIERLTDVDDSNEQRRPPTDY